MLLVCSNCSYIYLHKYSHRLQWSLESEDFYGTQYHSTVMGKMLLDVYYLEKFSSSLHSLITRILPIPPMNTAHTKKNRWYKININRRSLHIDHFLLHTSPFHWWYRVVLCIVKNLYRSWLPGLTDEQIGEMYVLATIVLSPCKGVQIVVL
jgi:hypothetical protein